MAGDEPIDHQLLGQLDHEAATWCARMHGDEAGRWQQGFDLWLRRGALHRRAYNRIEEIYLLGARVGRDVPVLRTGSSTTRDGHRKRRVTLTVGAAILCLPIAASTLWSWRSSQQAIGTSAPLAASARVDTDTEPSKDLRLADGSRVQLAQHSTMRIAFTQIRRLVSLDRGFGRFSVVRNSRSFVLRVGGGSITTSRGTFVAGYTGPREVHVRLLAGDATVISAAFTPGAGSKQQIVLQLPGSGTAFTPGTAYGQRAPEASPSPAQARTVGELVDLSNAIPGVRDRVVLANPALRQVALSGSFRVHEPEIVAGRLAAMLGLNIDRSQPGVLLLR